MSGPRSFARERNHTVGKNSELKVSHAVNAGQNNAARILPTHTTKPKPDDYSNVKLRGTPTIKPEQRAYRDETHNFEMPRQGVSLLNVMLGFFFFSYLFFFFLSVSTNRPEKTPDGVTRNA